jgi:hypothetical protein
MARDEHGRFLPGASGNRFGRPRKIVNTDVDEDSDREAFFDIDNEVIPITVGGRKVKMTIRKAIDRQMALKAASGHLPAMIQWSKRRDRYIKQLVEQTGRLIEQLVEGAERIKDNPEDVTDDYIEVVKACIAGLNPQQRVLFKDYDLN